MPRIVRIRFFLLLALLPAWLGCAGPVAPPNLSTLQDEVADTERGFARTMAERDAAGFASFVSVEAVFVSDSSVARGKAAIVERWKPYFAGPAAPFSWRPDRVEVLASGDLALSSGPVFDPAGRQIAVFKSVWRREAPRTWRIVFDSGCDACPCKAP